MKKSRGKGDSQKEMKTKLVVRGKESEMGVRQWSRRSWKGRKEGERDCTMKTAAGRRGRREVRNSNRRRSGGKYEAKNQH